MHKTALWTPLAYLLCLGNPTTADYTSDYNRLCPGNNPVSIGNTVYTATCDKTLGPMPPAQKLTNIQSPTPEECAQVCAQDGSSCSAMIWANNACFQSSDQSPTFYNAPGAVVLTPPPSSGKTAEQLEAELNDCNAAQIRITGERDECRSKLTTANEQAAAFFNDYDLFCSGRSSYQVTVQGVQYQLACDQGFNDNERTSYQDMEFNECFDLCAKKPEECQAGLVYWFGHSENYQRLCVLIRKGTPTSRETARPNYKMIRAIPIR
ncbi:hypothetical protein BDV25DRAFT_138949 [Aspergillus avenaceus]|uniref:Apple domain-containing protein n=1 Tax=Aspergillus avenaceus TaxID=36643 RepID=A0A5N6TZ39_ASPAV|nr:hypothetical protein BDV25DRAFT_138949 [Aspergillus avenaceus]